MKNGLSPRVRVLLFLTLVMLFCVAFHPNNPITPLMIAVVPLAALLTGWMDRGRQRQ